MKHEHNKPERRRTMREITATITEEELQRLFRAELDKRDMRPFVYIAAPYAVRNGIDETGGDVYSAKEVEAVIESRMADVNMYAAHLLLGGQMVFSPLTHSHYLHREILLKESCKVPDYYALDLLFLQFCHTMYVLQLDGWEMSTGVQKEIAFCNKNGIDIRYVTKEMLSMCVSNFGYANWRGAETCSVAGVNQINQYVKTLLEMDATIERGVSVATLQPEDVETTDAQHKETRKWIEKCVTGFHAIPHATVEAAEAQSKWTREQIERMKRDGADGLHLTANGVVKMGLPKGFIDRIVATFDVSRKTREEMESDFAKVPVKITPPVCGVVPDEIDYRDGVTVCLHCKGVGCEYCKHRSR